MTNIIYSDIYRMRHSAATRNTLIGLVITILFLAVTMYFITSDGLTIMLDTGIITEQQDVDDINAARAELDDMGPRNAAGFARELLSSNFVPFFFLAFIIMIFGADFSHGTYRNTQSYEDNRCRVYFAKLLLSIVCCIVFYAASILLSWLIGGIVLGFGGFSAQYFVHTAVTFLLMLPTQIGMICLGHCIVAFTKKVGSTIAIYLIGPTLLSVVLQTLAMFPRLGWFSLLDWSSNSKLLIDYWTLPAGQILISVCGGLIAAAVTTALGAAHYRKADLH